MNFSKLKAGINLFLFLGLVGGLLLPYGLLLLAAPKRRHAVAQLFFKGCLVLTGIRLKVHGQPHADTALFAVNHASYLDIPILGAAVPGGVFVAKSEVADWPLFGFLARLSRTIFISRTGTDAARQRGLLAERMNRGDSLLLFPEGTSTNGAHVRPFKSTLFAALEDVDRAASVQPVTIAFSRRKNGAALSQAERELFTWFGDMTLAPHLINVFGISGIEVDVVFHAPIHVTQETERKQLAQACWDEVSGGLHTFTAPLDECDQSAQPSSPRMSSSLSASA